MWYIHNNEKTSFLSLLILVSTGDESNATLITKAHEKQLEMVLINVIAPNSCQHTALLNILCL